MILTTAPFRRQLSSHAGSTAGLLLVMTMCLAPREIIQSQIDSPRSRDNPTNQYVLFLLNSGLESNRLTRAGMMDPGADHRMMDKGSHEWLASLATATNSLS